MTRELVVRYNDRPRIPISTLPLDRVSLHPGERPQVACPDCGRWRILYRGIVAPHHVDLGERRRCPGSGQRIHVDPTAEEWLLRLDVAQREAGARSGRWTYRRVNPPGVRKLARPTATPPLPPPVFRITSTIR